MRADVLEFIARKTPPKDAPAVSTASPPRGTLPHAGTSDQFATDPQGPRVVAFPLKGIDYVDQLYRAAADIGVHAVEGRWAGRWILQNIRPGDLAHIHWPSFLYFRARKPVRTLCLLLRFFLLASLIRLRGARVAWTAHNLYPHDGGRTRWAHRAARSFITRIADRVFVHGPTAARIVSREFGISPARLVQVPHGHWRTQYPNLPGKTEARRRMRLPLHNVSVYGFIGSCLPYKNVESILEAFPRLDDSSHLLIAGAFPSPEYLRKVRSLTPAAAAHRVHIIPKFLGADEIMGYVAGLDALVLSYKEILTSGVMMLALSAGIPVVAPSIGGIPDVINDFCGLLYDPRRPDGLLEAMREVRRRSYSADEIIAYARSFDWSVSARRLKDVIEQRTSSV